MYFVTADMSPQFRTNSGRWHKTMMRSCRSWCADTDEMLSWLLCWYWCVVVAIVVLLLLMRISCYVDIDGLLSWLLCWCCWCEVVAVVVLILMNCCSDCFVVTVDVVLSQLLCCCWCVTSSKVCSWRVGKSQPDASVAVFAIHCSSYNSHGVHIYIRCAWDCCSVGYQCDESWQIGNFLKSVQN